MTSPMIRVSADYCHKAFLLPLTINFLPFLAIFLISLMSATANSSNSSFHQSLVHLETLFPVGTGVNLFQFCSAFYDRRLFHQNQADDVAKMLPEGSLCARPHLAYIFYYDLGQIPAMSTSDFRLNTLDLEDMYSSKSVDYLRKICPKLELTEETRELCELHRKDYHLMFFSPIAKENETIRTSRYEEESPPKWSEFYRAAETFELALIENKPFFFSSPYRHKRSSPNVTDDQEIQNSSRQPQNNSKGNLSELSTTSTAENTKSELLSLIKPSTSPPSFLRLWQEWTLSYYDDAAKNKREQFGPQFKSIFLRWLHETSINFGVSNLRRLLLPILVFEEPLSHRPTEELLLHSKMRRKNRRQLAILANFTIDDTCRVGLPKNPLIASSAEKSCRVKQKCNQLCGLDCYFNKNEECYWTWDADNYTETSSSDQHKPGQNGFMLLESEDIKRYHSKWPKEFFGPYTDSRNYEGSFLYLLGLPTSNVANFTDKRVISELIRETGNNCSVIVHMKYQNIEGTLIEFGTQNLAKAYSAIKILSFTQENRTARDWKRVEVKFGRYLDPFSISIDIRRSMKSEYGSFIAIDSIRLHNCEPESSVPIDCSAPPSRYYVCPHGEGVPCVDGPSMLCDLKADCPGGNDEKEEACMKMPEAARCDFNNGLCGWYQATPILSKSSVHWNRRSGKSDLGGIDGDINYQDPSKRRNGHYLYVGYSISEVYRAAIRSPTFPPPPKYNNNVTSPYYRSCRIRLYYNAKVELSLGQLEVMVHYFNDSSSGSSLSLSHTRRSLTSEYRMNMKNEGWNRWEAVLPSDIQLRYAIVFHATNALGTKTEYAIDNFSMSPQCFGLGVPEDSIGDWRYNMTDTEFCKYYGRTGCIKPTNQYGYHFSDCGLPSGPLGPGADDCKEAYKETNTSVMIGDPSKKANDTHHMGYVTGIQRWIVPQTGLYTMIVSGSSGAEGRKNKIKGKADQIRALVHLTANETLFISVGQMGRSACFHPGMGFDTKCDEYGRHKRESPNDSTDNNNFGGERRGRRPPSYGNPVVGHNTQLQDGVHKIYNLLSITGPNTNGEYDQDISLTDQDHPHLEHGRIHVSPDTRDNVHNGDYFKDLDQALPVPSPIEGGGGGGGASIVFRFDSDGIVQPILIAAGGGGGSAVSGPSLSPDAQGLLSPWDTLEHWKALVTKEDVDAGSGGGWNTSLSLPANFSVIYSDFVHNVNRTQPTGFSSDWSWIGGLPCSPNSGQFGGFGGGGAGCFGGGGGGGFVGGRGGRDESTNGQGGWSYFNPEAVVLILDARSEFAPSGANHEQGVAQSLPKLWNHEGPGHVLVLPSLPDSTCQANCSELGALCMALNRDIKLTRCVCPDGIILDHVHPRCSESLSFLAVALISMGAVVTTAILGLLCLILYTQYQRRHLLKMRRKNCGGGPDSQLNRLRALNAAGNGNSGIGGILMTEYNPNYEFGGGTCTLQDLKEIPREQLRLVKGIGQGAFGEVYQGFYKKSLNDPLEMAVAVKTLPEMSSNQAELDFLMEALIMSKFNHPNIVHFIGVCFEKHPRFIILELLAGGDLKSFLRESRPKSDRPSPLVMKDLLLCAMDVAKGCEYLEGNHFIHRDIAARNCLLTTKGPGRVVKIADFGMARDIYRADYYRKGGKAMLPVKWMPPEAFLDGIFTSKTDIWSFGILLWEVMSLGYMPYPGRGNQEVMQLVTNGGRLEPPNFCPGPVYGLMCQCWHPIPEERPNFRTILERLGYCLQDPEVVMAPLPLFHRPLSQDNSRETSLSSGRGGGRSTGPDTSGSGSGVSLPMRGQNNNTKSCTPTTPDTPSTSMTNSIPNAASSDYLIPLTGPLSSNSYNKGYPSRGGKKSTHQHQRRSVASHTTGTPVSSPSDDHGSNSDNSEDTTLLHHSASRHNNIKTVVYDHEAETSFTTTPYTNVPPSSIRTNSKARRAVAKLPPAPPTPSVPIGASRSLEPPIRTTSVIPPNHLPLPSPPGAGGDLGGSPLGYSTTTPPPPPKGYEMESPELPPLPPLPPGEEAEEAHPLMAPLDVTSLRSRAVIVPKYNNMDSPRDVIGGSSRGPRKETLYTITSAGANGSLVSNNVTVVAPPPSDAPPSEISV